MADRDGSLHTGHRQRVKNRFKEFGIDSFEYHEILEFLLFFGIPYKDTNEIAHKLIKKFGKFSEVFDASIQDLKEVGGMTENAAILIKALPQIAKKYREDKLENVSKLSCLNDCIIYLKNLLSDLNNEMFLMLTLDSNEKLIRCNKMTIGSVNKVHINVRNVLEQALQDRAVNIVLAHNHPSGNLSPSEDDLKVTQKIINSLSYADINVYDHIIIAGDKHYSFASERILNSLKRECPGHFLSKFAESNKEWLAE